MTRPTDVSPELWQLMTDWRQNLWDLIEDYASAHAGEHGFTDEEKFEKEIWALMNATNDRLEALGGQR